MTKRLEIIKSLVRNDTLVDIGADHGIIPLELLKEQKIKHAYLTDIHLQPLLSGYKNILNNGFINSCCFILNDGLDLQVTSQKVDIIISGMGGEEIIRIISNLKQPYNKLILQPNNNVIKLRKYLKEINLQVEQEILVTERKKDYFILEVSTKENNYSDQECYIGRIKMDTHENYLLKRIEYLESISSAAMKEELQKELLALKNWRNL